MRLAALAVVALTTSSWAKAIRPRLPSAPPYPHIVDSIEQLFVWPDRQFEYAAVELIVRFNRLLDLIDFAIRFAIRFSKQFSVVEFAIDISKLLLHRQVRSTQQGRIQHQIQLTNQ